MDAMIYRLKDVLAATGLPRSSLYGMIARGAFPPPIRLGARSVGWPARDILEWISDRPRQPVTRLAPVHGREESDGNHSASCQRGGRR
jgi:prophage regulatory protein